MFSLVQHTTSLHSDHKSRNGSWLHVLSYPLKGQLPVLLFPLLLYLSPNFCYFLIHLPSAKRLTFLEGKCDSIPLLRNKYNSPINSISSQSWDPCGQNRLFGPEQQPETSRVTCRALARGMEFQSLARIAQTIAKTILFFLLKKGENWWMLEANRAALGSFMSGDKLIR